jgi:tetratricopeptide (TPR) repeat protein
MIRAPAAAEKNIRTAMANRLSDKVMFQLNKIGFLNMILLAAILFGSSGCGMWTNFKTYFNTYYNANRIFEEAEEKVLEERKELFYYEEKPISKGLVSDFDEVIEKTSAILQHSKESDFVDEALLMTGKSFYYQLNYSRALRKFNELGNVEDSDYELENKLWIGKTLLQLRDFDKALQALNEVKQEAISLEEDEILIETYRIKIGYLIYIEEYQSALDEISELLNTEINDELRAEVNYEMGLLYKLSEDYQKAENAFEEVQNYAPTFEIDYESKFEIAKIKNQLGFVDESLELFNELRDEDKYSDNWDEIDLEIGKIYYDKSEFDEAFKKFTEVDTTYKDTEASSIARFYRAELLENQYRDYDSALVLYKGSISGKTPDELRFAAQKKSGLLNRYIAYHDKLNELSLQLKYILEPETFLEDSLEYVEMMRQDSVKNAEMQEDNPTNRRGNRNTRNRTSSIKPPERPNISADSIQALNSKYYFELANLLFSEFDDPDSAYYYYNLSLDEKRNNPNEAQTYFAIGNYFLIKENKEKADSMFTIVYDNFEFDPIRNEAAKILGKPLYDFDKDPVEEEYLEAEKVYSEKKYESAISKLYDIYKNNPKSIYASKSLYTIGFILENDLDMPDSAASVYGILSKQYRTSEYAKAIQVKYTGYSKEMNIIKAKEDSIKAANELLEADQNPEKSENEQLEKKGPENSERNLNGNDIPAAKSESDTLESKNTPINEEVNKLSNDAVKDSLKNMNNSKADAVPDSTDSKLKKIKK